MMLLKLNRPRAIGVLRYASRWHSTVSDKYGAKIAEKARAQGVSVEELVARAREQTANRVAESSKTDFVNPFANSESTKPRTSEANDKAADALRQATQIPKGAAATKELSTYVDVDKLRLHIASEIESIWKARFINSTNEFCGSMTAEAFSRLYVNARRYSTFVLPLPRGGDGIELHYVQWSFVASETVHCLITSLAEYKLHGEYAHPHTTVMLHTDLAADKGVVLTNTALMNSEMPMDLAVLLTLNLQRFYTASANNEHGKEKIELLRQFNSGDPNFSVDKLIAAAETLD